MYLKIKKYILIHFSIFSLLLNLYIHFYLWKLSQKRVFPVLCEKFHLPHCPSEWRAAVTVVSQLRHFFHNIGNDWAIWKHEGLFAKRSHKVPRFRQGNCLVRILEHEAIIFVWNGIIKFGVGNVDIVNMSHICFCYLFY